MKRELGWSRGELSVAVALAILISALFAAPVGHWLDFRGPRLLMTAGSIGAVLLTLAWSQVRDLAQFYVLWALMGVIISTVLYEPAFAVATAWFERRRARAIAAITLVAGFASTIFLPVENSPIEVQGWRHALSTLAAFVTVANAIASVGIGAAHDWFGSYDPLFWAMVVLSIVPSGAILLVRRPTAVPRAAAVATAQSS